MKIYYNQQGKQRANGNGLNTIVINSDTNETFDCSRIFYKDKSLGFFDSNIEMNLVRIAVGMFAESNITNFDISLYNLEDGTEMFCNCVDLVTFKPSEMRLLQSPRMFLNCKNIKDFKWENRDYKLQNAEQMFAYSSLKVYNPYLDDFFMPRVTNAKSMFEGCEQLEEANIGARLYGVTEFDGRNMFKNCPNLKKFSGCLTIDGQKLDGMFSGCNNLEEFTLELKDFHKDETIIVDGVEQKKHYSALERLSSLFDDDYFTSDKKESIKKMSLDVVGEKDDDKYLRQIFQNNKGLVELTLDVSPYISETSLSYVYDVEYISNGDSLFEGCSNLTNVNGSLDLTSAYNLFKGCNLSKDGLKNVSNLLGNGSQEIIFNKDTEDEYSYQYLNQVTLGCNEEVKDIIKEEAETLANDREWIVTSNVKPLGEEDSYYAYLKILGTKTDFANDEIAKAHKANYKVKVTFKAGIFATILGRSGSLTFYFIMDDDAEYYASPEEFGPEIKGESELKSYSSSFPTIKKADGSIDVSLTRINMWYDESFRYTKLYKSNATEKSISKIELTNLITGETTRIAKVK